MNKDQPLSEKIALLAMEDGVCDMTKHFLIEAYVAQSSEEADADPYDAEKHRREIDLIIDSIEQNSNEDKK